METKSTAGPWSGHKALSHSENDKGWRITTADGRRFIADVSPVIKDERGDASEEGEANANLIAAAPDLLEACKMALDGKKGTLLDALKLMQAAIAKAEGRQS